MESGIVRILEYQKAKENNPTGNVNSSWSCHSPVSESCYSVCPCMLRNVSEKYTKYGVIH